MGDDQWLKTGPSSWIIGFERVWIGTPPHTLAVWKGFATRTGCAAACEQGVCRRFQPDRSSTTQFSKSGARVGWRAAPSRRHVRSRSVRLRPHRRIRRQHVSGEARPNRLREANEIAPKSMSQPASPRRFQWRRITRASAFRRGVRGDGHISPKEPMFPSTGGFFLSNRVELRPNACCAGVDKRTCCQIRSQFGTRNGAACKRVVLWAILRSTD